MAEGKSAEVQPKKKSKTKMILIIIGIVVVLIILGVVGYKTWKYYSNPLRKFASPAVTEEQKNQYKQNVNSSLAYDEIAANTNKYTGQVVHWTGKVFTVEKGNNYVAFQIWLKPDVSKQNVVCYYGSSSLEIKENDYIEIYGAVGKEFTGKNAFGANLKVPTVKVGILNKADRNTVEAPARKTWNVNQSQDQYGFVVNVEKIEIAEQETRVYLKVKNNSADKISFYSFNTKLVQKGSQVKTKYVYNVDKKYEIPSEILPNTEEDGILYFEKIDETKPVNLMLEASNVGTSDYTNYHKMEFNFTINPQ